MQRSNHWPRTLWLGLIAWGVFKALLLIDLVRRDFQIVPHADSAEWPVPAGAIEHLAWWVAVNFTPLCWMAYLLVFDGLTQKLAAKRNQPELAPFRARPNRMIAAALVSVISWCVFDVINFYFIDAWRYHGMPAELWRRMVGYTFAFATISPAMFLAAHWFNAVGLKRLRSRDDTPRTQRGWLMVLGINTVIGLTAAGLAGFGPVVGNGWLAMVIAIAVLLGPGWLVAMAWRNVAATSVVMGLSFSIWAVAAGDPVGNMALWVGLIYLLDPWVRRMGGASILEDWLCGRWGRTVSLMAGGALCGLLWEFWNYGALTKWTYDLPFLGAAEQVRYFEMPVLGFAGFLPFAIESWVMLHAVLAGLRALGVHLAERLPDDDAVL